MIEIDGTSHSDKQEYDKHREEILKSYGLFIARYDDLNVVYNFHSVEKDFNELLKQREHILCIEKSTVNKGST